MRARNSECSSVVFPTIGGSLFVFNPVGYGLTSDKLLPSSFHSVISKLVRILKRNRTIPNYLEDKPSSSDYDCLFFLIHGRSSSVSWIHWKDVSFLRSGEWRIVSSCLCWNSSECSCLFLLYPMY